MNFLPYHENETLEMSNLIPRGVLPTQQENEISKYKLYSLISLTLVSCVYGIGLTAFTAEYANIPSNYLLTSLSIVSLFIGGFVSIFSVNYLSRFKPKVPLLIAISLFVLPLFILFSINFFYSEIIIYALIAYRFFIGFASGLIGYFVPSYIRLIGKDIIHKLDHLHPLGTIFGMMIGFSLAFLNNSLISIYLIVAIGIILFVLVALLENFAFPVQREETIGFKKLITDKKYRSSILAIFMFYFSQHFSGFYVSLMNTPNISTFTTLIPYASVMGACLLSISFFIMFNHFRPREKQKYFVIVGLLLIIIFNAVFAFLKLEIWFSIVLLLFSSLNLLPLPFFLFPTLLSIGEVKEIAQLSQFINWALSTLVSVIYVLQKFYIPNIHHLYYFFALMLVIPSLYFCFYETKNGLSVPKTVANKEQLVA